MVKEGIIIVAGLFLYCLALLSVMLLKRKNIKSIKWKREGLKVLLLIYILLVIKVTMFPILINSTRTEELTMLSINLIPLVSIFSEIGQIGTAYDGDSIFVIKLILRNVGGNILLLMPLGFLAPILWSRFRSLKSVLLLGLLVSISIESLQLVEMAAGIGSGRAADIDDVICNTTGACIGYYIFTGVNDLWNRAVRINHNRAV
ncbi:VanZ family protein [Heyndrickxia acidicola]|uniref:VanZ family protein n=1 Tax=Heyndrickxia acidicola TaxID=209389 RepID=A0ABU6MCR5_9BACI|nr:VanZ family protein [Heyndrickxia acidicola]MED1202224.1 VanZ family protein [Heyndrickxia acidicola]